MSAALTALIDRQAAVRETLTARSTAAVVAHFRQLGSWNREDVARFIRVVSPPVQAAQIQTAALTEQYLRMVMLELGQPPVSALSMALDINAGLRGVPPDEVYARPFVTYWTALKKGTEWDTALNVASDRLARLVEDDLSLAHRETSRRFMSSSTATGFRRVIHPEMARTGSCGLCVAASSQEYHSSELMPIHSRCGCETLPIIGDLDPGADINTADLYDQAVQTADGANLSEVRFQVTEHGELGPILRKQGDAVSKPPAS